MTKRDIERRTAIERRLRDFYVGSELGSSMAVLANIADTVGRDRSEPSPGLSVRERKAVERATIREYLGPWRPFQVGHDRW